MSWNLLGSDHIYTEACTLYNVAMQFRPQNLAGQYKQGKVVKQTSQPIRIQLTTILVLCRNLQYTNNQGIWMIWGFSNKRTHPLLNQLPPPHFETRCPNTSRQTLNLKPACSPSQWCIPTLTTWPIPLFSVACALNSHWLETVCPAQDALHKKYGIEFENMFFWIPITAQSPVYTSVCHYTCSLIYTRSLDTHTRTHTMPRSVWTTAQNDGTMSQYENKDVNSRNH